MNVIYIRTSTDQQDPKNQLADCESINEYGNYALFQEQQSAWKDNLNKRDKFKELLRLIKNGRINHLIVWDLDRLYRKRTKIVEFFKLCKVYNCNIHSYRQIWLEELYKIPEPWNEIVSDLTVQIMGWMAEEESIKKSERIKLAVRKQKGRTVSYKGNKWGRKALSTFKKNKVSELRSQGLSIRNIANELNISVGSVHKTIAKKRENKNN